VIAAKYVADLDHSAIGGRVRNSSAYIASVTANSVKTLHAPHLPLAEARSAQPKRDQGEDQRNAIEDCGHGNRRRNRRQ
jgi:hypothetical protein